MSNVQSIPPGGNDIGTRIIWPRQMLASVGFWTIRFWQAPVHFLADAVAVVWQSCRPVTWRRTIRAAFMRQCHAVGTRALPFILVSGVFIGFGMVAQALYWLEVFGGTWLFGGLLSVVLVQEVAPVLIGLIVVGRSGSAIIVELGTMKAEGRVHALDAQGIDPFVYLVIPRVLAITICMFCLTVSFVAVAMVAGFFSANLIGISKYSFFDFMDRILTSMDYRDYFLFSAKTLTIGFVVGLLSCKTALSISGDSAQVLDILPRGFAKSALATLLISVALTILL